LVRHAFCKTPTAVARRRRIIVADAAAVVLVGRILCCCCRRRIYDAKTFEIVYVIIYNYFNYYLL
jgi:hypothetical protein